MSHSGQGVHFSLVSISPQGVLAPIYETFGLEGGCPNRLKTRTETVINHGVNPQFSELRKSRNELTH